MYSFLFSNENEWHKLKMYLYLYFSSMMKHISTFLLWNIRMNLKTKAYSVTHHVKNMFRFYNDKKNDIEQRPQN